MIRARKKIILAAPLENIHRRYLELRQEETASFWQRRHCLMTTVKAIRQAAGTAERQKPMKKKLLSVEEPRNRTQSKSMFLRLCPSDRALLIPSSPWPRAHTTACHTAYLAWLHKAFLCHYSWAHIYQHIKYRYLPVISLWQGICKPSLSLKSIRLNPVISSCFQQFFIHICHFLLREYI